MSDARSMVLALAGVALAGVCWAGSVSAAPFVGDVTSEIVFGTGNANGDFVIDRDATSGIELGLRAKQRFTGVTNFDGVDTYTFPNVAFAGNPEQFDWNFEFSINSDFAHDPTGGTPATNLDAYAYRLSFNTTPDSSPDQSYDPARLYPDNSYGNNATVNGGGAEGIFNDFFFIQGLGDRNNVVQGSQNLGFNVPFVLSLSPDTEPTALGTYTFTLEAFDPGDLSTALASTSINVEVVPEPVVAGLLGVGALGLLGYRVRREDAEELG